MDSTSSGSSHFAPIENAPEHIKKIIIRVLTLERERLYLQKPHISDDIARIVMEVVDESMTR